MWLAVAAYAALLGSLATDLYDAWTAPVDSPWPVLVMLVAAHLGLGVLVRRAWVLALPVVLGLVSFAYSGASGLAWLFILLEVPVLAAFTGTGWLVGRSLPDRAATSIGIVAFVVAACPAGWAVIAMAQRGPRVPASVQSQLMTDLSLGNLCPHTRTPGPLRRRLRRSAEVLIDQLRRRPDDLVTVTDRTEQDPEGEERRITIRQFAERQLEDLRRPGRDCVPALTRRIEDALQDR